MCVTCDDTFKTHAAPKRYDGFVNLHLHTAYSLLDGMSKPEDVVKKVASLKQTSVAITEHGNVFSSVKVHKLAKQENIKHIYGAEFYVTDDRFVQDKSKKYYHLTVLAKNEQGRRNINKLASLGYLEGFYYKPRIDHRILKEYSEGLIVLSGCFVKDTKVFTKKGLKNIQDVETGDIVITHTGEEREVLYPTVNHFEGNIYEIKTLGSAFPITATDDHEFFVIPHTATRFNTTGFDVSEEYFNQLIKYDETCDRLTKRRYKKYSLKLEPSWKMAKDLTANDVILVPIDERVNDIDVLDISKYKVNSNKCKKLSTYEVPVTNELLEVFGIYVAEGSVATNNYSKIQFSLHSNETDIAKKIINTMGKYFDVEAQVYDRSDMGRNSLEIVFGGMELAMMFADLFGEGDENKRIPEFIKYLPPEKQMYFIKGALLGDGSFRIGGRETDVRYVSTSKQLIADMSHILHRNWLNPCVTVRPSKVDKNGVKHKEYYVLALAGRTSKSLIDFVWNEKELKLTLKDRMAKDIPFVWSGKKYMKQKVQSIKVSQYSGDVYCLNVDIDNSFVAEGLIVHNCMASEVQQALAGGKIGDGDVEITEGNKERAKEIIAWYRETFGSDYYLEVQAHRDLRQQKLNRAIIDLAVEMGIDYVATTDSHFAEEEDLELHGIFIQIGTNREAGETYEDCFIMNSNQVYDRLIGLEPEEREAAIKMSLIIADKCDVKLPLSEPIIPHVDIPDNFADEIAYLKHLINQGWKYRGINKKKNKEEYKKRLDYEFNAISKMGFEGYFLLVESYVNSVRRRGIARGSSGGSLIAYLLRITEIDPIPYGLYFERFIDVGALDLLENGKITRKELKIPDVDSDFGATDREKVVEFITNKYGEDKFAAIGQFGYIWDKSAVKDVGRVLGIPFTVTNQITQQMGDLTIEYMREAGINQHWFEQYPKLFEYAEKIAGLPKSFGVHPCGKIITINDLDYYTAIASNDGTIVFQGDMEDTDDLGLVKVDLLGLKSIDVIYDTLEMIGKDYDYINPDKLDFSDENILQLFREGRTDGVFQFESVGMKETLRQVKPNEIMDLAVCNALFRPASMKHIEHFAKRKHGEEEINYLHSDLIEVLGSTQGIFVFQEQLITLGRLAGMRNPDSIRKATAKKKMEMMVKVREELFDGLGKRGWSQEQLNTLWDIMIDFASYSFNLSHALAYAIIAWQMAKLKHYHPVEFMTALLNSKIGKIEELSHYIAECKRMGIKVRVPDINSSQGKFVSNNGEINFGLLAIRGIGEPTVELIEKLRKLYNKPFTSFGEFYSFNAHVHADNDEAVEYWGEMYGEVIPSIDMMPSDAIINLIKSGAFGMNKNELLTQYAEITYTPLKWVPKKGVPSKSDFEKAGYPITPEQYADKEVRSKIFNEFKYQDYLKKDADRKQKHIDNFFEKYVGNVEYYEFDTMGAYLTKSPFDKYIKSIKDFYTYEDGADKVLLIGTIISKEVKKSSRGGQFAKLKVLTPHGVVQAKAYSSQYSEYKNLLAKGATLVMLTKRSKDEAIISKVKTFDEWQSQIELKRKYKDAK